MTNTNNKLEFQNREIQAGVDEAYQRNIDAGLGKKGLSGVLGDEVAKAKENGGLEELEVEKDERIKTREKYAGRDIFQEIFELDIDPDLPIETRRQTIAKALDCRPDQISFNRKEALSGNNIVFHWGSLGVNDIESADNLVLPLVVSDCLYLDGLKSAKNLVLPVLVGGKLKLNGLNSAENLNLSISIGWDLYLEGLTSIEDLDLSNIVFSDISEIHLSKFFYNKYIQKLEDIYPNFVNRIRIW